uniref:DegT/DnrJ/EryC1/StrS family aminotransferase n=1 Tax=Endozoicomonas sp. YOMI1 TaxID=2828739 RepID=UPI0021479245
KPLFADVDRDSQNITAETTRAILTEDTKAIIFVHLAGLPCDMDPIMNLAAKHNLYVIEDCAQAHGAKYKGKSVGSIGHIGAWSFCQDKIMTTGGEGGMVTTNDEVLWKKMWSFKDHGKCYDAVYNTDHPKGYRWLHNSFGTNWRITEVQSAIGRIQLKRMPEWTRKRQSNAAAITEVCRTIPALRVPEFPAYMEHACYKHYVFLRPEMLKTGWDRDRIVDEINTAGIPCYQGSCSEIYLEKAFDNTDFRPKNRLAVARELGDTSLMFLVHPTLTACEISKTVEGIQTVMKEASL